MEALKASGVCRRYGNQEVLKDFSLTVQEGGFEALMGPSGSGKSTFLHPTRTAAKPPCSTS